MYTDRSVRGLIRLFFVYTIRIAYERQQLIDYFESWSEKGIRCKTG